MLSPELLQQIQHIQLKAGHLATDALAGEYSSVFKGVGMEFEKVRDYVPGDEVRTIDWNVTARMNEPFVKVYREERELTLMLLVDASASLDFGTTGKLKKEIVAELAAVLAFLASKNNDKVGLLVYSDHVECFIPPKKGRAHIWQIIRTVLTHERKGTGTATEAVSRFLLGVCKRKTLCFCLSDFFGTEWHKPLQAIRNRHDLVCVPVYDPWEREVQSAGVWSLQDAETGALFWFDTTGSRKAYQTEAERRTQGLESYFRRNKMDAFFLSTAGSVVQPLVQLMHQRERRAKGVGP
jgi:uncharacterized protein (DUF58 family)